MAYPDDQDVAGALTGQQAPGVAPLQSIMAPAMQPQAASGFLSDPKDRAALLQIGLQLMQPPEWGQTTAGQIGTAIGAGGEQVARSEAQDIAQQNADVKAQRAEDMYRLGQDKLAQKGIGGISAQLDYRMHRDDLKDQRDEARRQQEKSDAEIQHEVDAAESDLKEGKNLVPGKPNTSDTFKKYGTTDLYKIRQQIEARRAGGGGANAPRQAPNGNYYVPDPNRPGKWLKVNQ